MELRVNFLDALAKGLGFLHLRFHRRLGLCQLLLQDPGHNNTSTHHTDTKYFPIARTGSRQSTTRHTDDDTTDDSSGHNPEPYRLDFSRSLMRESLSLSSFSFSRRALFRSSACFMCASSSALTVSRRFTSDARAASSTAFSDSACVTSRHAAKTVSWPSSTHPTRTLLTNKRYQRDQHAVRRTFSNDSFKPAMLRAICARMLFICSCVSAMS